MEQSFLSEILSIGANAKTLIVGTTTILGLSLTGVTPRVGLVRALTLGWRSGIKTTYPLSVRKGEIAELRSTLQNLENGQYVTVIGGKGNGKSCLIDTCLNRTFGVVKTRTESGALQSAIVDNVLREVTGIRVRFFDLSANAQRVLFFYNFMFKRPPIVVVRVPERQKGQQYADMTAAVRALADEFGLRVVVDGSPNSLPPELLTTNRQRVRSVEPMTREMIESIPEFQDFIGRLKRFGLDDAVWKVLGGCPAKYLEVRGLMAECSDDAAVVDVMKRHLVFVLHKANEVVLTSSPNTKAIVKLFRERNVLQLPIDELEKQGLMLDYPNKVFRGVTTSEGIFIEPATSAVELIIGENIQSGQDVLSLVNRLLVVK